MQLLHACNSIKKEILAHVFAVNFCEIFNNTFFADGIRVTASEIYR